MYALPKVDGYRIVSNYTQLKSRGNGLYYGLCPLHNEDTPSFHFNANANVFYCFGCKRGGNIFQFISHVEKIPISEVNEFLYKRYGYEFEVKKEQKSNELETFWNIAKELSDDKRIEEFILDKTGNDFLREEFAYIPASELEKLKNKVENYGLTEHLIEKGVFYRNEETKTLRFAFSGRIFTPIRNKSKTIVGFASRILEGTNGQKYLFSKFAKKYHLALYNEALELYRKTEFKQVFVVEGIFDALALLSRGIPATALLGTALSIEQINLLNAFENVIFLLDQDKPGLMSYHMIAKTVIETNRASFSSLFAFHDLNEDIDDILKRMPKKEFLNKLRYKSVYDIFIDFALNDIKLASPALKNKEIFREELIRRFMKIFKMYSVNEHAYNLMIRLSERAKYPLDILVKRVDYAIKKENAELSSAVNLSMPEYIPPKERKILRGLMFYIETQGNIPISLQTELTKYNYKSSITKAIVEFLIGSRQEISEDEYSVFIDIVPEKVDFNDLFKETPSKVTKIVDIAKKLGFKSVEKMKESLKTKDEQPNTMSIFYE